MLRTWTVHPSWSVGSPSTRSCGIGDLSADNKIPLADPANTLKVPEGSPATLGRFCGTEGRECGKSQQSAARTMSTMALTQVTAKEVTGVSLGPTVGIGSSKYPAQHLGDRGARLVGRDW